VGEIVAAGDAASFELRNANRANRRLALGKVGRVA
jgi:hypothetical protein